MTSLPRGGCAVSTICDTQSKLGDYQLLKTKKYHWDQPGVLQEQERTDTAKGSGPHEGGPLLWAVSLSLDVNKNIQILKREVLRSLGALLIRVRWIYNQIPQYYRKDKGQASKVRAGKANCQTGKLKGRANQQSW